MLYLIVLVSDHCLSIFILVISQINTEKVHHWVLHVEAALCKSIVLQLSLTESFFHSVNVTQRETHVRISL